MTNDTVLHNTLGSNQQWTNRCLSLLKEREKWNSSGITEGPHSEIADLLKKKEEEEFKLKSTQNKIQELEKQLNELNSEKSSSAHIKNSVLQLFGQSTKLIFDTNSSPSEIKGFVLGTPLKPFHIDMTKNSQQYVVGYLWQLINEDLK